MQSDYILLLNNDVVVDENFLDELVQVGESDEEIGVIGPSVYFYEDETEIQSLGAKINFYTSRRKIISKDINVNSLQKLVDVDCVFGCAFLAKTKLFERLGLLASRYFAYCEEVEWCARVKEASYRIICSPRAKIWHKKSKSADKIDNYKIFLKTRNNFWFMRKHASKLQYIIYLFYFFLFNMWVQIFVFFKHSKNRGYILSFLKGIFHGIYYY